MTDLRDYNAAVDFVDRHVAEGRGDKTAFIDPSRNLTYGELLDTAARIGPMLARIGDRAGKPHRPGSARHRRLSRAVLGRDPGGHRSGSGQHPC